MAEVNYNFLNENYPTMKICSLDESLNLSTRPLEKLKLTNGQEVLLHILTTDKIVKIDIHYNPDIGYFTCFGGACCKVEKPAQTKLLIPVAVYTVNSDMQVTSTKLEPYILHVSSKRIPDLLKIAQLNGDLTSMDLLVKSVGDKFPKLEFYHAGAARCLEDKYKDDYNRVLDFMKQNEHKVVCTAAKSMSAEEYESALNEKSTPTQNDAFANVNQPAPIALDALFGK